MATGGDDEARGVRHLIRGSSTAALATGLAGRDGWPYASLVLTAFAADGSPLLLLSDLAEHAKALAADDRMSLLFDGTVGHEDRLTGPRVTVLGRATPTAEPAHRKRFLLRHPSAAAYADFADFRFYVVAVEKAHLVAGFGRIKWLPRQAICGESSPHSPLAAAEEEIVAHMNHDHRDALGLYAEALLGLPAGDWHMTGIDEEGCDLRLDGQLARLPFDVPVRTPEEARAELVRLVRVAREKGGR